MTRRERDLPQVGSAAAGAAPAPVELDEAVVVAWLAAHGYRPVAEYFEGEMAARRGWQQFFADWRAREADESAGTELGGRIGLGFAVPPEQARVYGIY